MGSFIFLENTPLKFVDMNKYDELQTEKNRLMQDYEYYGKIPWIYRNEFDKTDNLFFQFRTDYPSFQIYLKNNVRSSTLVATPVKYYDDGRVQYNVDIGLTALSGEYRIEVYATKFATPSVAFRAISFYVCDSELMKLEWMGSDDLNDPFIWTKKACLRIEGKSTKVAGGERSTYVDTDGNYTQTYAQAQNKRILQIRKVPEYIQTLLDLAILHDYFYVNNELFGYEGSWDFEAMKNNIFAPKLTIIQKDYRNFTSDPEITGDIPVYADKLRTTGLVTRTTGLVNRKTNN